MRSPVYSKKLQKAKVMGEIFGEMVISGKNKTSENAIALPLQNSRA